MLLERVLRDDGVLIWKIAALTVAQIPALDKEFGYGLLGEWLPVPLFEISFLGIELWQWIGLTVLLAAAILMAWVLTALLARLVRPLEHRWRDRLKGKLGPVLVGPVHLAIAITLLGRYQAQSLRTYQARSARQTSISHSSAMPSQFSRHPLGYSGKPSMAYRLIMRAVGGPSRPNQRV